MEQSHRKTFLGLDIGTTKICAVVGSFTSGNSSGISSGSSGEEQELEILGMGICPSIGLKKGQVVNIEQTVKSIAKTLQEAKLAAGSLGNSAWIGIAGSHIYSFNSSGVVAVKSDEIGQEDIERVLESAQAVVLPSDRKILHAIPREYKIDSVEGIKDPIGMSGRRLEGHVHIVTGSFPQISNMYRCVEKAGINVAGITLQPIASSKAVLSEEEKEMGVVLIDIGGGTTDLIVWKEGSIVHSEVFPIGGNHFTSDLAYALKTSFSEAEKIKIEHGSVIHKNFNQGQIITLEKVKTEKSRPREVTLGFLHKVLYSRAEELFGLIEQTLQSKDLKNLLTAGVVITGGGALMKDMSTFVEYSLMLPTRLATPLYCKGMTENLLEGPQYSTVIGLLLEAYEKEKQLAQEESFLLQKTTHEIDKIVEPVVSKDFFSRVASSVKNMLKEVFS